MNEMTFSDINDWIAQRKKESHENTKIFAKRKIENVYFMARHFLIGSQRTSMQICPEISFCRLIACIRYQRSSPECLTISRFRILTKPICRGKRFPTFSVIKKCNCEKVFEISWTKSSPKQHLQQNERLIYAYIISITKWNIKKIVCFFF